MNLQVYRNIMKKTILLFPITTLFLSNSAFASELIITDEELARIICNHLEQTEIVKTAVNKAYSETKDIIDEHQKTTLENLAFGVVNANSFCSNLED